MNYLTIMIKPASALCNMRCKYCFYDNVANLRDIRTFGMMKQDTVEKMLANIETDLESGDCLTFAFQGGEPTLAGLEYFQYFVNAVKKWEKNIQVNYAIQTNAITLNEAWAQFLKRHSFLVGISMDLLQEQHDAVRVDEHGKGTWKKVLNAIKLLEEYHVDYNVLCTLTNQIARHPKKVWNQIKKLRLKYVQFTPCLGGLDEMEKSINALTPQRFASFYKEIFQYWVADFQTGKYCSIKLFDDLLYLMETGRPAACGMIGQCQPQLIIEADGSTYPCDFYCLDEYCLGNINEKGIRELYQLSFCSSSKERPALPDRCASCSYMKMCGGNCKRMQKEICCSPGDEFCGYQEFLNAVIEDLIQIKRFPFIEQSGKM